MTSRPVDNKLVSRALVLNKRHVVFVPFFVWGPTCAMLNIFLYGHEIWFSVLLQTATTRVNEKLASFTVSLCLIGIEENGKIYAGVIIIN